MSIFCNSFCNLLFRILSTFFTKLTPPPFEKCYPPVLKYSYQTFREINPWGFLHTTNGVPEVNSFTVSLSQRGIELRQGNKKNLPPALLFMNLIPPEV